MNNPVRSAGKKRATAYIYPVRVALYVTIGQPAMGLKSCLITNRALHARLFTVNPQQGFYVKSDTHSYLPAHFMPFTEYCILITAY